MAEFGFCETDDRLKLLLQILFDADYEKTAFHNVSTIVNLIQTN